MKLHELIIELQKIESGNANADVRIALVDYTANCNGYTEVGFVDVKVENDCATIRVTDPCRVEEMRANENRKI